MIGILMKDIILTDCDGVLLDWNHAFNTWCSERGYVMVRSDVYDMHLCYDISKREARDIIKQFNESAVMCQLPTFRDSKFWVRRIHEEFGYRFRVITSMSTCPYAINARVINLRSHFGEAIEKVISLDTGADKYDALTPYAGSNLFWIEDKLSNAITGKSLGLRSVLIEHDHNLDGIDTDIPRVKDWKSIYRMLKKETR